MSKTVSSFISTQFNAHIITDGVLSGKTFVIYINGKKHKFRQL